MKTPRVELQLASLAMKPLASRSVSALGIALVVGGIATADVPPVRPAALDGAGRMSIVVESASAPTHWTLRPGAAHEFVVEIGPVGQQVNARDYVPERMTFLTAPVTVRGSAGSTAAGVARITLRVCADCDASARSVGRRIYVDIVRRAPSRARGNPSLSAQDRVISSTASTAPDSPAAREVAVAPYDRLLDGARQRASILSRRPDIAGLIALRAEVVKRADELGRPEPARLAGLLEDLDRSLNEARSLQLARDRQALLESQRSGRKQ